MLIMYYFKESYQKWEKEVEKNESELEKLKKEGESLQKVFLIFPLK